MEYPSNGLILCFQHSREKTVRGWANVLAFPESPSICPVLALEAYLGRTAPLRHTDAHNLFISLRKPHQVVRAQTLARWMTNIMAAAGVDTSVFKQHSTRSALAAWLETSTKSMSVAQICKHAQWSNLTTTYRKFYRKVVLHTGRQKSSRGPGGGGQMVVTIKFLGSNRNQ